MLVGRVRELSPQFNQPGIYCYLLVYSALCFWCPGLIWKTQVICCSPQWGPGWEDRRSIEKKNHCPNWSEDKVHISTYQLFTNRCQSVLLKEVTKFFVGPFKEIRQNLMIEWKKVTSAFEAWWDSPVSEMNVPGPQYLFLPITYLAMYPF